MHTFRSLVKTVQLWSLIILFIIIGLSGSLIHRSVRRKRLKFFSTMTSWSSRQALRLLGISLQIQGFEESMRTTPRLVIANHVSYLDILILASIMPLLFITSVEVQKTFFMGFISTLGGSLFVERRNKAGIRKELALLQETVNMGFSICLYPEGTSSNGEDLLPFKSSLFQTAVDSRIDILPVCIRYLTLDGEPITPGNRDRLFYYGHISFFPHIFKLPFIRSAAVRVAFLPVIPIELGVGRKELSEKAYNLIRSTFHSLV